jgi:SAM-dependent methyltransferase
MTSASGLLNIGCGSTFHPQWTNLDFHAPSAAVIACDIRRGLPFASATFRACYSSHVLEHLTPAEGTGLLREIHRVLAPGGIVRVVVPDLELIVRDYLRALQRALADEPGAGDDYDWMMIQLLDQSVRRRPGGAMSQFWRDPNRGNTQFVVARAGLEAEGVMREARLANGRGKRSLMTRIRSRSVPQLVKEVRRRTAKVLVAAVAGAEAAQALDEGLFRNSGEIHHWMYDRYSLHRAFTRAGFTHAQVVGAGESLIPRFASFELDVVQGRVRKPDSLFMEAIKDVAAGVAHAGAS